MIDWLTFTSKCDSVDTLLELLGMDKHGLGWETKEAYMMGYPFRMFWEGVTILFGAREDMGICCTMSGTGCRTFESHSSVTWQQLLTAITDDLETYHITRLDLAYDDHTGVLDVQQLVDDTTDGYYKSKGRWWTITMGSEGTTIYHGSPRSLIRTRIYDKAAEQKLEDQHWIRVELQLRGDNATAATLDILKDGNVGRSMRGILANYLNYLEPTSDTNKSRWPVASYWQELLEDVREIHLWTDPGTEHTLSRLENWLVTMIGPSLKCYSDIYGIDKLLGLIKENMVNSQPNPKYQRLIDQHGLHVLPSSEHIIQDLRNQVFELQCTLRQYEELLRDARPGRTFFGTVGGDNDF